MDDFVVELPQNLVEGLVQLAVEIDVTNMQDLVHAILKEKLFDTLGIEVDDEENSVSLTQEESAEALASKLRSEANGESTFSSLGPSVDEAPDQLLSDAERASVSDTSKSLSENQIDQRLDRLEDMFEQMMSRMTSTPFQGR